jgi:hypothetical protein
MPLIIMVHPLIIKLIQVNLVLRSAGSNGHIHAMIYVKIHVSKSLSAVAFLSAGQCTAMFSQQFISQRERTNSSA